MPPFKVTRLLPLARGLAWRIARQPADVDDLIQTGLLAYHVDYKRHLRNSRTRAGKLHSEGRAWAFARSVLRRAMLGYYGRLAERAVAQTASLDDQVTGMALAHYASTDQRQDDLLEMHDYLDALERTCGRRARLIAQNLIEPLGECAVRLMVEVQRKRSAQLDGYAPDHPRVRFSHRAVRDAMALDPRLWDVELQRVRGFTREWLSKTV